jgi:pyridoxine 4-dehydrogenase
MTERTVPVTHAVSETWTLGELTVRRMGFGAMRLPGPPGERVSGDRERAAAVLHRARELGVNFVDTAAFYFSPLLSANELINSALGPYPEDLVIATKVGPGRYPGGEWYSARPDQLRGQVEQNLRELGRDHLDLVYLRRMSQESIAEHFGILAELREAGLIRELGVSSITPKHLAEAQAIAPVVAVQNRLSLDVRVNDEVLRLCTEQGIAFVAYYAIAGDGRESGFDLSPQDEAVAEVAAAHGASVAQIRLAWTLHQGPNVLAIPGTSSLKHLEENVAAGDLHLTDQELERLER